MTFSLKNKDCYYLIRQIINNKMTTQFKLYNINDEGLRKITSLIPGTVSVYIYNNKDNSRIDVTDIFGKKENIQLEDNTSIVTLLFAAKYKNFRPPSVFISKVTMTKSSQEKIKSLFEEIEFIQRFVENDSYQFLSYKLKKVTVENNYTFNKDIKNESNVTKGGEYEKFIGKKYESTGKSVIYNGLEHNKKDNGIDLIINEKDIITFVQCKNWISNEQYKINQKDLRAFIGDCYMYMLNKNINKIHHFHFIVSDDKLLTKSAGLYLKENIKLKYKIIPFE